MKFSKPREFRPTSHPILSDLVAFLLGLNSFFKELFEGLTKLRFEDNFRCWVEEDLVIAAGAEAEVANQLRDVIPTKWILVKTSGTATIANGDTAWTKDFVYLKNPGASSLTISVLFLR